MVLFGVRSDENRHNDHETVDLIDPTESRSGRDRVFAFHLFWTEHKRLSLSRFYWFWLVASRDSSSGWERPVFLSPTICCSQ